MPIDAMSKDLQLWFIYLHDSLIDWSLIVPTLRELY